MNLDILEKKMPEAIKYASNIITETPNFIEFAIAITDYMGCLLYTSDAADE